MTSAHQTALRIVDELQAAYEGAVAALRGDLRRYLAGEGPPDPAWRTSGAYAYPELRLYWSGDTPFPRLARAYARRGIRLDELRLVERVRRLRDGKPVGGSTGHVIAVWKRPA